MRAAGGLLGVYRPSSSVNAALVLLFRLSCGSSRQRFLPPAAAFGRLDVLGVRLHSGSGLPQLHHRRDCRSSAISSGWAARFIGVSALNSVSSSAGRSAGLSAVHTGPGATALTRMPRSTRCHARSLLEPALQAPRTLQRCFLGPRLAASRAPVARARPRRLASGCRSAGNAHGARGFPGRLGALPCAAPRRRARGVTRHRLARCPARWLALQSLRGRARRARPATCSAFDLTRRIVVLGAASHPRLGLAALRRRQVHAGAPDLRKADGDGLLGRPRVVLATQDLRRLRTITATFRGVAA